MTRDRNLGVTEASLGLTLVIVVLLAVGYLVLHYLGGPNQIPTVEVRPNNAAEHSAIAVAPEAHDEHPQVLTIESSDLPGHALRSPANPDLR